MYFLDVCNFENFNQNQNNELCLDFSKYHLIFEKPSTNQDPPKELNGKTLNSLKDNLEEETQNQELFIWSKFYRFDTQVFSKCSLPDNSWSALSLKRNYLFHFPFIHLHQNLQYLNLSHCNLTNISYLPSGLLYLNASYNQLTEINGEFPERIEQIKLKHNQLTQIPDIPNAVRYLDVSHNKLIGLPEESIINSLIRKINYENNPVLLSQNLLTFLDGIGQYYQFPIKFTSNRKQNVRIRDNRPVIPIERNPKFRTIYKDSQNVHHHEINDQVVDIFNKLKQSLDKDSLTWIKPSSWNKPLSWKKTKIFIKKYLPNENISEIFYSSGTITKLECSIRLILQYVITYVKKQNQEKIDLFFEMFKIEIEEMRVVCLTGILLRLFNCLYVVDETLQIKITDNMQKEARINIIKKQYDELMDNDEMRDPYLYDKHNTYLEKIRSIEKFVRINLEFVKKMEENLLEIDVPENEILEWTSVWKEDAKEFQEILDKMQPITDLFLENCYVLGQYQLNQMTNAEPFLKLNNFYFHKFNNEIQSHQCKSNIVYFDEKEVFCSQCFTWEHFKRNTSLSNDLGICCGQKNYIYQDENHKVCEKCFSLENLYKKPQVEIINLIHLGMEC